MANKTPADKPKSSVAATQPNKKGIAPGIAPTKIDIVDNLFKGVQDNTYNIIDIRPKKHDFDNNPKKLPCGLIKFKRYSPIKPIINEKIVA